MTMTQALNDKNNAFGLARVRPLRWPHGWVKKENALGK